MNLLFPSYIMLLLLAGSFGAVFASFFARMVMRAEGLTKAEGPRSQCDHCGHTIPWFHLIPVVSFIALRGKCAECHKPIDAKIWLAEVAGFIIAAPLGLAILQTSVTVGGLPLILFTVAISLITALLLYLAVYDMFLFTIPTQTTVVVVMLVIALNVLALVARWLGSDILPMLGYTQHLLTGAVAAGLVYLLMLATKRQGIGVGDVYVAFVIGAFHGVRSTIAAFYITIFSATVIGLVMTARLGKMKGIRVPLVPFLAIGFTYALVWGQPIFSLLFPYL